MRPWELLLLNFGMLQSVLAEVEPELSGIGLDAKGLFLLGSLDEYPHPAELAKAMCVPKPTISFLVKRAEAAGHLRREAEPNDLRRFRLSLTDQGRDVMKKGAEILNDAFGRRLQRLNDREIKTFQSLVTQLGGQSPGGRDVKTSRSD